MTLRPSLAGGAQLFQRGLDGLVVASRAPGLQAGDLPGFDFMRRR